MKRHILFPTILIAALGTVIAVANEGSQAPSQDDVIAHGKYIVHNLAMCIDCHSPRDQSGAFIESKHLTGSPLAFKPTVEMPWMPMAPALAGLPTGYTKDALIQYLMTGERPNGMPKTMPPMPDFKMTRADAEAVTAYLVSLAAPSKP